jgi:hypothetical protein
MNEIFLIQSSPSHFHQTVAILSGFSFIRLKIDNAIDRNQTKGKPHQLPSSKRPPSSGVRLIDSKRELQEGK